jgi:hypothetical protein
MIKTNRSLGIVNATTAPWERLVDSDQILLYIPAMSFRSKILCLAAWLVALLALAGCGGASSGSSSSSTSGSSTSGSEPAPAHNQRSSSTKGNEPGSKKQSEPSSEFLKPGSQTNTFAKFGHEASAEERESAGEVVAKSLAARASADFTTQCETLSKSGIALIPGAKNHADCPSQLKREAEPLSKSQEAREDTFPGSIAAFRVEGTRGWALYHGNDGKDYALSMEKEGDSWKVASVVTIEI